MSGALAGSMLGEFIRISNQTLSDSATAPTDARVDYILQTDGDVRVERLNGADSNLERWITPPGNNAAFEVKADINTGSLSGGDSTGVWLSLTSERRWWVAETGTGVQTCNFTVSIRRGSTTIDTATIILSADTTP